MSTYAELQDNVLEHQLSDARYRVSVQRWLNEAQRFIVLQTDFRTQIAGADFTLVAGTGSYALPSNFARVIDVYNPTDGALLTPLELRDLDDLVATAGVIVDQGKPTSYVIGVTSIILNPTPDAVYTVSMHYYKLPAEMDGSTVLEPELPESYHQLLEFYALFRAFQREHDFEAANYWRTEFDNGLMKLRGEAQYDAHDGPTQVQGTWGGQVISPSTWV